MGSLKPFACIRHAFHPVLTQQINSGILSLFIFVCALFPQSSRQLRREGLKLLVARRLSNRGCYLLLTSAYQSTRLDDLAHRVGAVAG